MRGRSIIEYSYFSSSYSAIEAHPPTTHTHTHSRTHPLTHTHTHTHTHVRPLTHTRQHTHTPTHSPWFGVGWRATLSAHPTDSWQYSHDVLSPPRLVSHLRVFYALFPWQHQLAWSPPAHSNRLNNQAKLKLPILVPRPSFCFYKSVVRHLIWSENLAWKWSYKYIAILEICKRPDKLIMLFFTHYSIL